MFPGIEYLFYFVVFLAIGIPLGLLAILIALMRRPTAARILGKFCVGAGLLGAAILGFLLFSMSEVAALAILLIPAGLGGAALAIAYYYKDRPPLKRWQIPFPALIYVMLVVAVWGGVYQMRQASYYHDRDQCTANFQRMPGIDNVVVHGIELSRFAVDDVEFSLAGRPDTLIRLNGQDELFDCKSSDRIDGLVVEQLGPWTFDGRIVEQDGKKEFGIIALSFRPNSALRGLIPLKIETIDDLVAHYDELVELLESWPRKEAPGHFERYGESVEYWVEEDPTFSSRLQRERK